MKAIPAVLIAAVAVLIVLTLRPSENRATQITICTNTEPATIDAFLSNSTVRGLNWSWPDVNWTMNMTPGTPADRDPAVRGFFTLRDIVDNTAFDYNYSYVDVFPFSQFRALNVSNMSCAVFAASMARYTENQSRSPDKPDILPNITYTSKTFDGVVAHTEPVMGSYLWCNRADNTFFVSDYYGFANYTETYVTGCTTRQTTSEEDACRSTAQPAQWNGTSCRCFNTGFALDALNASATCGNQVKAANETCGGPRSDTCVTGYACKALNATSTDTTGICTKRTMLDDATDKIKANLVASVAVAVAIGAVLYARLGRKKK